MYFSKGVVLNLLLKTNQMKILLLILALIISSLCSIAQSFIPELDYYKILVKDLDKSEKFYKNIMQFKEKETPWGDD